MYRLGVPSAIAAFLLWYLVSNVSANISAIRQKMDEHVMESAIYLRAICVNTAKNESERATCEGRK